SWKGARSDAQFVRHVIRVRVTSEQRDERKIFAHHRVKEFCTTSPLPACRSLSRTREASPLRHSFRGLPHKKRARLGVKRQPKGPKVRNCKFGGAGASSGPPAPAKSRIKLW